MEMWGRWERVRRESNQNVYYMCGTNKEPKYRVKSFERRGKLSILEQKKITLQSTCKIHNSKEKLKGIQIKMAIT